MAGVSQKAEATQIGTCWKGRVSMSTQLERRIRNKVDSVPQALAALARMERQLDSAKTYEAILRIQREAKALNILLGDVREVKERSQLVLALANRRIAQEINKINKASGRPAKKRSKVGTNKPSGRAATGIPKVSRSRLAKLLKITKEELKAIIRKLHESGKDATENAILAVLKEREIKASRKAFEDRRDKGGTVADLTALAESGQKFKVIYADPPWTFEVYSGKGKQRSAERYYDTLTSDEIKALPVAQLADKDCALFLWGVCPDQPAALEVIRAWGFEYKTVGFVWVKTTATAAVVTLDDDGLHWGMGYWTRSNVEPVLLATRGNPQRINKDVHQVVIAPVGEHSEKPEEVRRRIERLLNGQYLELFARKPAPGWTTWGNELTSSVKEAAE